MKGHWKRGVVAALLVPIPLGALLLWQAPVLARLPFQKAFVMYRDSRWRVLVNGRQASEITVYSSSVFGDGWPDLLVLDSPVHEPGRTKLLVRPAYNQVGESNEGPRYYQNLGHCLIRSDAASFGSLYSAKAYEGKPHFSKGDNYIRFRLPEKYEAYPNASVEIHRAE